MPCIQLPHITSQSLWQTSNYCLHHESTLHWRRRHRRLQPVQFQGQPCGNARQKQTVPTRLFEPYLQCTRHGRVSATPPGCRPAGRSDDRSRRSMGGRSRSAESPGGSPASCWTATADASGTCCCSSWRGVLRPRSGTTCSESFTCRCYVVVVVVMIPFLLVSLSITRSQPYARRCDEVRKVGFVHLSTHNAGTTSLEHSNTKLLRTDFLRFDLQPSWITFGLSFHFPNDLAPPTWFVEFFINYYHTHFALRHRELRLNSRVNSIRHTAEQHHPHTTKSKQ